MDKHPGAQPFPVPDPRDSEDQRQRKLAALRIRMHEQAGAVRTPEDWAGCLRLAARLPGESFANILVISAQRPGATMLRGYDAWQQMGRQVSRQEKGIAIFASVRRPRSGSRDPHAGQATDQPVPSWRDAERVGYLWDLSQTSGPAINAQAAIPPPPGRAPPGLWDALCWLARREGFAVEREYGCPDDGATMWAARRIRIPPGPDEQRAVWALAHQLGHVLLHEPVIGSPGTTTSGCTGIPKIEADSVAYIICTRCGIPTSHQFPSPPDWAGTRQCTHLTRGQGRASQAWRETWPCPGGQSTGADSASRGRRPGSKPVTESTLSLRAPRKEPLRYMHVCSTVPAETEPHADPDDRRGRRRRLMLIPMCALLIE